MNITFGIWRPQGPPVTREELASMSMHTRRFAVDGERFRISSEIGFGVQAQYTHARSRLDRQPMSDARGNVLVYDGRLDNYRDLLRDLDLPGQDAPDSEIMLSAYRKWGTGCFVRFVGDWALALWDSHSRTLYLARDHAGCRTLHYCYDIAGSLQWATYLDSFIGTDLLEELDPVYVSSYLAMLPCYGRTPYQEIQAVLPGHFVEVTSQGTTATQFWAPTFQERNSRESICDLKAEFLHLLEQSVARRTGPGEPVLAQLSGGMDSTSIVCVADRLRKRSGDETEPLDTLSFFDDSEPTWNERPYFAFVEAKRGRCGFHFDTSPYKPSFERPSGTGALYLYPGLDENNISRDRELHSLISAGRYRSILSGIGGDEFTGGIPNPAGEIADLVLTGRFAKGAERAIGWCLARRLSMVELLTQSLSFLRCHLRSSNLEAVTESIPWLTVQAREQTRTAIRELPILHLRLFGGRPKLSEDSETWWSTLRNQPHLKPSEIYRYEYRYPYLDRDLIEFLLRLPVQHLAQPGRRRSLMREALQGVVPEEILERRRKAFLLAGPLRHIRQLAPRLTEEVSTSLLVEYGYIDKSSILQALDETVRSETTRWWSFILRFAWLETWLQYRAHFTPQAKVIQDPRGQLSATEQVPVS